MERKTKIFTGVVAVALFFAFIGYYFSLFNGTQNNVSTYTNIIVVGAILSGIFWMKQKTEIKFIDILVKIDCVIFVIWVITSVAQLFI